MPDFSVEIHCHFFRPGIGQRICTNSPNEFFFWFLLSFGNATDVTKAGVTVWLFIECLSIEGDAVDGEFTRFLRCSNARRITMKRSHDMHANKTEHIFMSINCSVRHNSRSICFHFVHCPLLLLLLLLRSRRCGFLLLACSVSFRYNLTIRCKFHWML